MKPTVLVTCYGGFNTGAGVGAGAGAGSVWFGSVVHINVNGQMLLLDLLIIYEIT